MGGDNGCCDEGCSKDYWGWLWYISLFGLIAMGVSATFLTAPSERVPYGVITTRNCRTSYRSQGNYTYWSNNATEMVNNDWNIYPFYGICPANLINKKCVSNCQNARRLDASEGAAIAAVQVPADEREESAITSRFLKSYNSYAAVRT